MGIEKEVERDRLFKKYPSLVPQIPWTTDFRESYVCLVAQLCLTLCNPTDYIALGSSVHGASPGKNTGVGCHALLQGIFPTQGIEFRSPTWQVDSLPSEPQGKPSEKVTCLVYNPLFLLFEMLISWLVSVHSTLVRKRMHYPNKVAWLILSGPWRGSALGGKSPLSDPGQWNRGVGTE